MQPPSPRGPGAGALLLAFLAGGLGGAAGALLVQPRASSSPASDDTALKDSIAALERTVRALGEQIAGSSRMPVPAGAQPIEKLTPAQAGGPDAIDGAQLDVRLDQIAKLLEVRAAGGGSNFAGAASMPPLDLARAALDRSAIVALASEANDWRQLWRRHVFWTCQQVLDAYGIPDRVEASDGAMTWEYETPDRTLTFQFYEGMLINIWS
jgi:hypothetical protein